MVNTIIPIRLGEFVRAYVLGEKEGTGFAPGFSSIVVERTLDVVGLLSIGIVTMFLASAQAGLSDLVVGVFIWVGVFIAVVLAVIIAGIKKEDAVIKILTQITSKIPFVKKYTTKIAFHKFYPFYKCKLKISFLASKQKRTNYAFLSLFTCFSIHA